MRHVQKAVKGSEKRRISKMKMKLGITWCYLLFMLINHKSSNLFASAKSLETQHCPEHVSHFFTTSLNVTINSSGKVGKSHNNLTCNIYRSCLSVIKIIFFCITKCREGHFCVFLLITPAIHHKIYIPTCS